MESSSLNKRIKLSKRATIIVDKSIVETAVIEKATEILRKLGYEPVIIDGTDIKRSVEAIDKADLVTVVGDAGNWVLGGLVMIARIMGKEITTYHSSGGWAKLFSARPLSSKFGSGEV